MSELRLRPAPNARIVENLKDFAEAQELERIGRIVVRRGRRPRKEKWPQVDKAIRRPVARV